MQIIEGAKQTVERVVGAKIERGTAVLRNIIRKGNVAQTIVIFNWKIAETLLVDAFRLLQMLCQK